MSGSPVILVAMANDQTDHLAMLTRERKAIGEALQSFEDNRYIRLQVEPNAGIDDLFGLFNRFSDQIAIFHYAGHADGTALNLETAAGGNEAAHAGGLARLMGSSTALQLVFLNGCATGGQVETLLASGVKAVIATAVPINDAMATEFAEQFYQALAARKSIKQAFDTASALIASRYGDKQPISEFRGFRMGGEPAKVDASLSWGLYVNPGSEESLGWLLPEQAETQVIIRGGAFSARAGTAINDGLIQTLFNAIAPHSLEVGMMFEVSKRTGKIDLRTIRQQIVDAFPSPIGEQLRKLFAGSIADLSRLEQILIAYRMMIRLIGFAMISQLWNALYDNPKLSINAQQWTAINAFRALDATKAKAFDYVALIIAISDIFVANKTLTLIEEVAALPAALTAEGSKQAHIFMAEMQAELAANAIPASEVESFCVQAETHLGTIFADFAFIVGYKLATIKGIAISKTRHKPAEFRHRQVLLDRVTAGFADSEEVRSSYTDNESVILLRDVEDVSNYLNLTPFIIDQNALTGNDNTKLYYFSHFEADGTALAYYSVADISDRLVISDAMDAQMLPVYGPIKGLFQEYLDLVVQP